MSAPFAGALSIYSRLICLVFRTAVRSFYCCRCFLDSIYSRENLEAKLADKFFDGDVPFMYDNLDDLPEA